MSENTKIEWCDATFNPWIGCTKISPACEHCYAAVSTPARARDIEWGAGKPRVRTSAANWKQPLRWNNDAYLFGECKQCGHRGNRKEDTVCDVCGGHAPEARRRVFCASLADVFDSEVDPQWRADLFDLIELTPHLDWLILTKRIGNVFRLAPSVDWFAAHKNVWLGITICNQEEADRDIPKLLDVPACVRFLSCEPLLDDIDISNWIFGRAEPCPQCPKDIDCDCGWTGRHELNGEAALHWVIVGGESGHHARPMNPEWARSLRDQCSSTGLPFFFKQFGEFAPENAIFDDGSPSHDSFRRNAVMHICNSGERLYRVGKRRAGRHLDGVEWSQWPNQPIEARS